MTSSDNNEIGSADIARIMRLLPHRYPFLMIDKIIDMKGDTQAIGVKCVTINELFFQGHFPGKPVMPGVLLIEAMAQTAGGLVVSSQGREGEVNLVYFMSIDKARFRQPVVPGDVVFFHIERLRQRGNVWKYKGEARVEDKLVAEAEITAMIADA